MALKRTISILFITDNQKQPFSIKLGLFWFKALLITGALGIIIFITGIFVYIRLIAIAADYDAIQQKYSQSLKRNSQINVLMRKFVKLQKMDEQIRQQLGLPLNIAELPPEGSELLETEEIPADEPAGAPVTKPAPLVENPANGESLPNLIPVEGFITRGFIFSQGNPRDDHLGIDIVAKEGTAIVAAGDGIVVFSNWTYEAGNNVIIDHGNGYLTFYKHNKQNLVLERQYIHRGEPVAVMGNSGISSGPHLHFEIWKNGQPVDPRSLILNL